MPVLIKNKPESLQQQNAKLKAKLARADRLIAQLEAETAFLRNQMAHLKRRSAVPPTMAQRPQAEPRSFVIGSRLERSVVGGSKTSPTQRPQPTQVRRSRKAIARRFPARLLWLTRIALLASVMTGLAGAGFWSVQRLRFQPQASQTPAASPQSQPSTAAVIQPSPTDQKPPNDQKQTFETLAYNVQAEAPMPHSEELQAIVDGAVALAASKSLDTKPLSITLIDLKGKTIAGYQQEVPRYPASVVKLFWLVVCEAQIENNILQLDSALSADLNAMIVHSDNDAASRIFDRITQTTSGSQLSGAEYDTWLRHRLRINQFFRAAGFEGLSISQKNYPIYSLKLDGPGGRELQMLDEQRQPIRSLVTSDQAARLMSDIYAGKAISANRSQEMMALLTRDLNPEAWKKDPENAIAGFLGEPLPADVRFASKVGMTSKVRHEVAFIESKDGSVAYILAVFGTDPTYSQNAEILPSISKAVYTQMVEHSAHANATKETDG